MTRFVSDQSVLQQQPQQQPKQQQQQVRLTSQVHTGLLLVKVYENFGIHHFHLDICLLSNNNEKYCNNNIKQQQQQQV
jgi:hypothetical protein